jgi:hypothetical protein
MRWLSLTVCLLSVSACLVAWVYLRDRDTSDWRPPESQLAYADAARALAALSGTGCRSGCATELVGHTRSHSWLVRVTVRGRAQCLQIDLYTFGLSPQRGLSGVQPSGC